jgi:truncated hemoglobin YjbI
MSSEGIDLPVLVEGIEEFYRNVYGCPLLGPIFRGINMVVLRKHVSYFLHNLCMWDSPMSAQQLKYLTRAHRPLLTNKGVTRVHFDSMLHHLREAMQHCGADPQQLAKVEQKLAPFRATFPPPSDLDAAADCSTIIPHVCPTLAPDTTSQLQQQGSGQQQDTYNMSDVVAAAAAAATAAGTGAAGARSFSSSSSSGEDSDDEPHLAVGQREGSHRAADAPRPLHSTHPQLAPLLTRPAAPSTPTTADEPHGAFVGHPGHPPQLTIRTCPLRPDGSSSSSHGASGHGTSTAAWGRGVLQAGAVRRAAHIADMVSVLQTPASTSPPATPTALMPGLAPAAPAAASAAPSPAAASVATAGVRTAPVSRNRVKQWFKRLIKSSH